VNCWWPFTAFLLNILENCFQQWDRPRDHGNKSQGGALWRGQEFQTCTNILNNFF
jgi:hypothetical protein